MIAIPSNKVEYDYMVAFLHTHALIQPTIDLRVIGWVTEDTLRMVVGLNAFVGRTCQIHVAMEPGYGYTPKEMLNYTFKEAFIHLRVAQLLGIVNSNNRRAMAYDRHLGFKEITRLPMMHTRGGDMVLFGMKAKDCKYLNLEEELTA